ncbi:MAG TPA: hypothetical protein VKK79_15565 [Candidatus Lokiarchaeia archaeon]|nr:hypothetical protein [Candidatus Lokiarchaeia archaeon]
MNRLKGIKVIHTNGQWLIRRLFEHGCFVTRVTTIPDEAFFSLGVGESDVADYVVQLMGEIPGIWIESHLKGRRRQYSIVEWQVTALDPADVQESVVQVIAAVKAEVLRLGGQLSDQDDFE